MTNTHKATNRNIIVIGIGCFLLVVLGLIAIIGFAYFFSDQLPTIGSAQRAQAIARDSRIENILIENGFSFSDSSKLNEKIVFYDECLNLVYYDNDSLTYGVNIKSVCDPVQASNTLSTVMKQMYPPTINTWLSNNLGNEVDTITQEGYAIKLRVDLKMGYALIKISPR